MNEQLLVQQTDKLIKTQKAIIFALSSLAEMKDLETGQHLKRMQEYSVLIAQFLRYSYALPEIDDLFIRNIYDSSVLHDIGKVGIPDNILRKPGKLTFTEYELMKDHTTIGHSALKLATQDIETDKFIQMALDGILHHHENWDGSGYPARQKEEEIPIAARIISFSDYYDALTTKRPYKLAYAHKDAMQTINEHKYKFDPKIYQIFLENENEFLKLQEGFAE